MQEANLAWELIDAIKPQLNIHERNFIFVTVGSGETFVAIRQLLKWTATKHIPLQTSLVRLCAAWLDSYALHEDHEYLRCLIKGLRILNTIQPSAPRGRSRPIKPPKRSETLAVKELITYATTAC